MNTTSTAAMKFSVEVVILPVRDVNRALRFYVDQVGFTCCSSAPSPGAQSKTVRGRLAKYDLRECATSDAFLSAPRIVFGRKVRFGSFSSDQPAPDALGMFASLRSRPNLRTAAIRRGVPLGDIRTAAKTGMGL